MDRGTGHGFVRRAGVRVGSKGHMRYSAGPHRGKYVHRVLVADLCREWCYWGEGGVCGGIPPGWDVHHLDGDPQHNSLGNLCLVPHEFHSILTRLEEKWRRAWMERYWAGGGGQVPEV